MMLKATYYEGRNGHEFEYEAGRFAVALVKVLAVVDDQVLIDSWKLEADDGEWAMGDRKGVMARGGQRDGTLVER